MTVSRQLYRYRTKTLGMSHAEAIMPAGYYKQLSIKPERYKAAKRMIELGTPATRACKALDIPYKALIHRLHKEGLTATGLRMGLTGRSC